jgi:hypothetical protein
MDFRPQVPVYQHPRRAGAYTKRSKLDPARFLPSPVSSRGRSVALRIWILPVRSNGAKLFGTVSPPESYSSFDEAVVNGTGKQLLQNGKTAQGVKIKCLDCTSLRSTWEKVELAG